MEHDQPEQKLNIVESASSLPKYSQETFRDKIAVLPMDEEVKQEIDKWWQGSEEMGTWVTRFKEAVEKLPSSTPEKKDARAELGSCPEDYSEINNKLKALLEKDTSPIQELYVYPIMDAVGDRPDVAAAEEIVNLISEFKKKYWTTDKDQVVAICEAIDEVGEQDLELIRLKVAQWAFEEYVESIPKQNLFTLFEGVEDQSLIDELEMEKSELKSALARAPWTSEKRERFRRIHKRLREAMDKLEVETRAKTDFDEAFEYATGHAGKTVSAIAILKNAESAWHRFKNDSTLQDFWRFEREEGETNDKE